MRSNAARQMAKDLQEARVLEQHTSGNYFAMDDPDAPPWFEQGKTSEVSEDIYRYFLGTYHTKRFTRSDRTEVLLCTDEPCNARLLWQHRGKFVTEAQHVFAPRAQFQNEHSGSHQFEATLSGAIERAKQQCTPHSGRRGIWLLPPSFS